MHLFSFRFPERNVLWHGMCVYVAGAPLLPESKWSWGTRKNAGYRVRVLNIECLLIHIRHDMHTQTFSSSIFPLLLLLLLLVVAVQQVKKYVCCDRLYFQIKKNKLIVEWNGELCSNANSTQKKKGTEKRETIFGGSGQNEEKEKKKKKNRRKWMFIWNYLVLCRRLDKPNSQSQRNERGEGEKKEKIADRGWASFRSV